MLQNRVDPWGKLHAVPERGALMGNRGVLHDAERQIVRQWQHKRWVTCLLHFKGIQRPKPFSTTSNYSELFFLDEATAFAAGHRPCHFCQRERSEAFKAAWVKANSPEEKFLAVTTLDAALHKERTHRDGTKVSHEDLVGELPVGTMFDVEGTAFLVGGRGYLPWTFEGYGAPKAFASDRVVKVLTPQSVVKSFSQAFIPRTHSSAV